MNDGERPKPIVIVDYDPAWPAQFEEERRRLEGAAGPWLADIQHIGSTSVPGLAAKPIIDIMAGLRSLDEAVHCIERIEALGYRYVPEFEDDMPYRRYFWRGRGPGEHTHHIHMVETSSGFWERHLLFRDYLRRHPEAAAEYAALKRELARRYHYGEIESYATAKTDFVRSVENVARAAKMAGGA